MINKTEIKKHLKEVKAYIKELEGGLEWVEINNTNCPTLKKYGVKPFRIMKKKMRKNGEVWNNITFYDAQKEAKKLGYRLPDIREILALLEQYRKVTKTISCHDNEFLGIEELSYDESVCYEWIEVAGVAAFRGGGWYDTTGDGPVALYLSHAPSSVDTSIGFRCASNL